MRGRATRLHKRHVQRGQDLQHTGTHSISVGISQHESNCQAVSKSQYKPNTYTFVLALREPLDQPVDEPVHEPDQRAVDAAFSLAICVSVRESLASTVIKPVNQPVSGSERESKRVPKREPVDEPVVVAVSRRLLVHGYPRRPVRAVLARAVARAERVNRGPGALPPADVRDVPRWLEHGTRDF